MGTFTNLLKNCLNFPYCQSFKKIQIPQHDIQGLPPLITTYFPSCTHTPATVSHMALLTTLPTAMPFHSVNSLPDGPSYLLCLLIIPGTSPCPLRTFLESPVRINGTILFFFLQSLMEHPCLFLEIQKQIRQETVSFMRTKMLSDKLPYIVYFFPRSYVTEL